LIPALRETVGKLPKFVRLGNDAADRKCGVRDVTVVKKP
jgi:hypothetical protein